VIQSLFSNSYRFYDFLALSPSGILHGRIYQLITFQLMHSGLWHLVGNQIGIYFFGRAVEEMLGSKVMFRLYFLSGTIGGLLQVGLGFLFPAYFGGHGIGASAGVFGLIAAFATLGPNQPVALLLLPIAFPAKYLLWGEAALALIGIFTGSGGIAHGAHLGGMLTGILCVRWFSDSYKRPGFFRVFEWLRERRARRVSTRRYSEGAPRRKAEALPGPEFISREVDPILEKISAHGIHSLTDRERQILEAARTRMAKK
jgi:membrane associated rhomboid family serine protease